VKIGFKFQYLGKISYISTFDPPSSFRSIPTLAKALIHCIATVMVLNIIVFCLHRT